jgi:hypothetical protein
MTLRTITSTMSFGAPFVLEGIDRLFPGGTYKIDTDEELIQGLSFTAYRRTATVIHLHANPGQPGLTETLTVEPSVFDAAVERDRISAISK